MTTAKRRGRPTKKPVEGERVSLGLRVTASIKRRLDEAAEKSGRSQSQEAEFRIERSFAQEDASDGPDMRRVELMMAATFAFAGSQAATTNGHPEWSARDWLADKDCYRAAFLAVATTLLKSAPDTSPHEMGLVLHSLIGRVGGILAADGKIQWRFEGDAP